MNETLWNVDELAEYLDLTPAYIRDMARCGKIPADCIVRPLGCRKYRFVPEKIADWARSMPTGRQAKCGE